MNTFLSIFAEVPNWFRLSNHLWFFPNRNRLLKLPDKGERIARLHDKIAEEIEARNAIDKAAELFSELNIVEKGVKAVTHMEWNGGKVNGNQILVAADTLDSDNDEEATVDPLKLIAQSRDVKLVKVEKPQKSLITEADLEDIKSLTAENSNNKAANGSGESSANSSSTNDSAIELEPHAINMCKKDVAFDKNASVKQKFLPFRTTKSDVHSIEHEKQRKLKHWENTAATPPVLRNTAAQLIPLQESIETERHHKEKLREQLQEQAEQRLAMRKKIFEDNISLLPAGSERLDVNTFFQSYRQRDEQNEESDEDHFSDNSDDGEEPETGGVSIVVYD